MRRLPATLFAASIAVAAWTAVGRASEVPFEAVRNLQALQDQIAEGDAIAQAAYAKAIVHTARVFMSADQKTWADPRNARALVLYLFSGGNAPAIAEVVPESAVAPAYRALYTGALAYGLGDDEKARLMLAAIDAKSLPSGLGGHLALVQATLCTKEDRAKAIERLDLARLLEPGTLIEEAALRKEMSLIGATGDVEKFSFLARRYLSAFSRSVYADNFRQLVASAAMEIGNADSEEAGARLSRLAANLEKTERRRLYLAVAHQAVLAGRARMAARAAEEASRLTPHDSPEEARAMVYLGAATIVGDRYDTGVKTLREIDPDRLGANDRALRDSAIAVAEMIRRPTVVIDATRPAATHSMVVDGERSIATAEDLLRRASR